MTGCGIQVNKNEGRGRKISGELQLDGGGKPGYTTRVRSSAQVPRLPNRRTPTPLLILLMIRFFSAMAALLCWANVLHALPAVRVLAWDDVIAARKLSLISGTTMVPITNMHPQKRTPAFRLKGEGGLMVRALDKPAGADGKPVDLRCTLAEGIKRPLLLLLPDEAHPTGLRGMVIEDDPAGFAWGSYRFINTTPKELVVQFEDKAIRIAAGWKPVNFTLGGAPRGFGVRVALAEAIEQPLYSAVWEYDANIRTLVFMVPGADPRLSPVVFKAIPEDKAAVALDQPEEKSPPSR